MANLIQMLKQIEKIQKKHGVKQHYLVISLKLLIKIKFLNNYNLHKINLLNRLSNIMIDHHQYSLIMKNLKY